MVDIYTILDDILLNLNIPFYHGMPEFSQREEPCTYLVYDTSDSPEHFSEGYETEIQWNITINIFSPMADFPLMRKVSSAMKRNGFVYEGGGEIGNDKIFPYKKQYYQEYKISIMEDEIYG